MRKSEEDFNVKKHAEYDVSELHDYVNNFSDEWLLDTSRQNRPNTPHTQTNTYYIYTSSIHWKHKEKFVTNQISQDEKLLQLVEPIVKDLERIHNGVRGNVLLIKLKAKEDVAMHEDTGDYLMMSRRNHVPIITIRLGNKEDELTLVNPKVISISDKPLVYFEKDTNKNKVRKTIRYPWLVVDTDNLGKVEFKATSETFDWKTADEFFSDAGLLEAVLVQRGLDAMDGIDITHPARQYSETITKDKTPGRNERVMLQGPNGGAA